MANRALVEIRSVIGPGTTAGTSMPGNRGCNAAVGQRGDSACSRVSGTKTVCAVMLLRRPVPKSRLPES
jgi:hypothetical protein